MPGGHSQFCAWLGLELMVQEAWQEGVAFCFSLFEYPIFQKLLVS